MTRLSLQPAASEAERQAVDTLLGRTRLQRRYHSRSEPAAVLRRVAGSLA